MIVFENSEHFKSQEHMKKICKAFTFTEKILIFLESAKQNALTTA